MARKSSTKTRVASSTSLVPVVPTETNTLVANEMRGHDVIDVAFESATIGDNSRQAIDALPTMSEVHDRFADTMRKWADADQSADLQRADAALRIMQRHELMVIANTGVALPTLASLATYDNRHAVFSEYLKNLTDEFAGKYITAKEHKGKADTDANAYRAKVEARMRRALRLAANMAWAKITRESYDHDKRAWRIAPTTFLAPGWMCPMLTHRQVGEALELVPFVYLMADSRHHNYTANNAKGATSLISLSADQLDYAIPLQIAAKTSDTPVAGIDDVPASSQAAKRAARQTGQGNAVVPPADDSVLAQGTAGREFYVAQLNKLLMSIGQFVNNDTLVPVKRIDLTDGAWNVLTDLSMIEARIKHDELQGTDNGKVPSKHTPRKAKAA